MTDPFKVIEANERQPLVSLEKRPSEHPTQSEKKSSNLIEWSDVERATHLVTEGDDQATWRPSSPIVSIMESVSAQVCCKSSWLSSKALKKLPLSRKKDRETLVKLVKNAGSLALLSLSVYIVMAAIWTNQTKVAQATNPLVATLTMWSLIIWLGLMEGGQGSLVGLQPIDKDIYAKTHPIAHQCAVLAHEGENLNRFILGRQFLVFLVVFVVNMCSSAVPETKIPFVSDSLVEIFLDSGLATIIITVILGQLAAEVNATKSMFDFVNSYFMLVTLWITLAVEWSGLLHAVYLVQYLFAWATGKSPSDGVSRSTVEETFFWLRVIFSTAVLGYACTFTFVALFHGQTDMYKGVPNPVTMVLFFVLLCVIGMMEGMQIALFAVVNLPEEELKNHHVARANCDLTFTGSNFQAFLIGRQVCVTFALFVLATIITIDVDMAPLLDGSHEPTVMGVSAGVQEFLNSGLPGALITTIIASLAWRIIASSFPIAFMSSPIVCMTIHFCLFLESTGLFSAAWYMAMAHKYLAGFRPDEQFTGVPLDKGIHGGGEETTEAGDTASDTSSECTDEEIASVRLLTSSSRTFEYGSTMSFDC